MKYYCENCSYSYLGDHRNYIFLYIEEGKEKEEEAKEKEEKRSGN